MNRETAIPVEEVVEELAPKRRFRSYPDYRDSQLGPAPTPWSLSRIKHVGRIQYGLGEPPERKDDGILFVRATDIYRGVIRTDFIQRVDPEAVPWARAIILKPGDIIVVRSGAYTGDSAIVADLPETAIAGYDMVIRPSKVYPRFLAYVMLSRYMLEGQIHLARTRAAQPHLNAEELGSFSLLLPSTSEQQAIAAFLDRETARIDELVAKKQRLIELLAEKRTALISHAVTKGLNPDAPMKEAGIEWLGSIPEHWSVRRMASFATKLTNGFVGPTRDILVLSGLPYIQSLHIKQNSVVFDGKYFVPDEWLKTHEKVRLATDDVLVVQTGDIGQVACVPPELDGAGCHALIIIRPVLTIMREPFLSLLLNSDYGYHSLKRIQTGALHPHLNCTFVREIFVPVPPLREQDAILSRIAEDLESLSKLRERISSAIDRLREYRSALITAAVTGKIDVRGEV